MEDQHLTSCLQPPEFVAITLPLSQRQHNTRPAISSIREGHPKGSSHVAGSGHSSPLPSLAAHARFCQARELDAFLRRERHSRRADRSAGAETAKERSSGGVLTARCVVEVTLGEAGA